MGTRNEGKDPELKTGWEKEALQKVQGEELKRKHGETLSVLDALRRSRKSRGGVGAPLQVPAHLRDGTQLVITDEQLKIDMSKVQQEAEGGGQVDDDEE